MSTAVSMRRALDLTRRLAPIALALALAALLYDGIDRAVDHIAGPPGFTVDTSAPRSNVTSIRTDWLLAPEVIPAIPFGGARAARATLLAHLPGRYQFTFGAAARGGLSIDGARILDASDQRIHDVEIDLTLGLHAIAVDLAKADDEGTVMLAMRAPGLPGGTRLLGPGDVVAASVSDVAKRLHGHADVVVALAPFAPAVGTAAVALALVALAGSARRRRAREELASLWRDPAVRSIATVAIFFLIAAPVLRPLFAPGYYECHEEESFMVRLDQFAAATSAGVPMGRWFPDPVYGRGCPFLCLYAPLLYLLAWPFLAAKVSALTTMKILSAGMILVAGGATFGLVRRRASRGAALLAATLLLYAPYFQYDLYLRGALAETLGFATFPLTLWALDAALDRRARDAPRAYREVALLALSLGLVGSSHNITGYFATFFIAMWVLLRLVLRETDWDGIVRITVGGALGFLLTVFYSLPAIFDKQRVHIDLITDGFYFFGAHFHGMDQVLYGTPGRYNITLGVAADLILLAAIAATVKARLRGPVRDQPHFVLTLQGIGAAWFATALITQRPLGEIFFTYVPLAKFVEFPWRLFLFGACGVSLTAAGAIDGLFASGRRRTIAAAASIVVVILSSLWFVGPRSPLLRRHTHEERMLRALSIDYVTSMNEYLPITVVKNRGHFGYTARIVSSRGARIVTADRSPGRYSATIANSDPAVVEFDAHWFPGWRGFVDGNEVAIGPASAQFDDDGLIRVLVPSGHHEVVLRYGRTPMRLACDLISLVALLGVLGLLGVGLARRNRS